MAQAVIYQAPPRFVPYRPTAVPPKPASKSIPQVVATPVESAETQKLRVFSVLHWCLRLWMLYAMISLVFLCFQGVRLYHSGQVLNHEWQQQHLKNLQDKQILRSADRPDQLERLARERLGFVGPDEIAVKLVAR